MYLSKTTLYWDIFILFLEHHDSVGVIIPVANESNQYIVCADRDIYKFKWENEHNNLEHLNKVDEDKPYNQFNDGKADKIGRLWIGKQKKLLIN